jgi:hypothetical protein
MDSLEIDLDSECVWLDDAWLNREDLVRKIKAMMDAGDFQISRPSQALEALTRALASARLLALRVSPEMSDALNAFAQNSGRPVGAVARDAIATFLASAGHATAGHPAASQAQAPAAAAVAPAAPTDGDRASTAPSFPAATGITTEPVSPAEAANAVALKPKRREDGEAERGWFEGGK